eukprot:1512297-Pleurochrysis_carterae.AAC.3
MPSARLDARDGPVGMSTRTGVNHDPSSRCCLESMSLISSIERTEAAPQLRQHVAQSNEPFLLKRRQGAQIDALLYREAHNELIDERHTIFVAPVFKHGLKSRFAAHDAPTVAGLSCCFLPVDRRLPAALRRRCRHRWRRRHHHHHHHPDHPHHRTLPPLPSVLSASISHAGTECGAGGAAEKGATFHSPCAFAVLSTPRQRQAAPPLAPPCCHHPLYSLLRLLLHVPLPAAADIVWIAIQPVR